MEMPNLHPHPLAFPDNVIADSTFVLHHISVRHLSSHPFDITLSPAHKKYLAILASPHSSVIRQVSCLVIPPGVNSTHRHLLSVVTSPLSYASEDIDTAHYEYTCGHVVDMREYTERDGGDTATGDIVLTRGSAGMSCPPGCSPTPPPHARMQH